jgi:hypothetical protein
MNLKIRRSGFLLAIMVLTMTTSIVSAQGTESSDGNKKTLVGTWRTVVTVVNCQTGSSLPITFHGLFTFHKDGTMSEYGIGPGSSPSLRSPGHGVWEHQTGWQDYSASFMFYRYDAIGTFIGSQKAKASLHLDGSGDKFTTTSSVEILNADDNVIATGCASTEGTRFTL